MAGLRAFGERLPSTDRATPREVDTPMEKWGMAMGLLAVYDMAGVDIGINVHKANADQYPIDPTYYQAEVALGEHGRYGQKSGKGYYLYAPGSRQAEHDPQVDALVQRGDVQTFVPLRTLER